MLELPNNFKERIINRCGETGKEWLETINSIVEKYQKQFNLENLYLIEDLSLNVIIFAKCSLYGDIVMKIGQSNPASISEINVMKHYSSDFVPITYYSSTDDKFQLLERIFPGYSLKNLRNMEQRVQIFSDLANNLLITANDKENFETFENIFYKRINYAYENKAIFSNLLPMINIATNFYQKIRTLHLPKYILHFDLHHKNILKTQTGWKAIDPLGIIGEKVFESCNFIRSEIENTILEEKNINKIIFLISKYFKEDRKLILEALYIYIIEKIIFYIKNKSNNNIISYNINVCKEILKILHFNA